jgi:hypothetical protein
MIMKSTQLQQHLECLGVPLRQETTASSNLSRKEVERRRGQITTHNEYKQLIRVPTWPWDKQYRVE